ncbi:MAG: glycosyltransferase [Tannerellaceae bacterium]|nr:glycosyltransferase [Tannerellaceae bacterium]
MNLKINCFLSYSSPEVARQMVEQLRTLDYIQHICFLSPIPCNETIEGAQIWQSESLTSAKTLKTIAGKIPSFKGTDYFLLITQPHYIDFGLFAPERMLRIAQDTGAGLVYADHYRQEETGIKAIPLIDYQAGSLRDDFNFGPVLLYNASIFCQAVAHIKDNYQFAALYDLRLTVSRIAPLIHINEYLYTIQEENNTSQEEQQFAYVDPKNRTVQGEMEQVCTRHLKAVGGYLVPNVETWTFDRSEAFPCEASIIIPVRNRIRTIADAVRSALSQKTTFPFNVIVIDNYSTDGTTEVLKEWEDERLVHVIPESPGLGIGGCWNTGVHHPACGKFAVQLDSDDIYSDDATLQKIVDAFYEQQCAMVVGTYMLTDFDLKPIPPGIIDHREWTPENGHNNALRINGLGAPRAFYTPLLRECKVPDTSYGEDYALGLWFSRSYRIGRMYEVLYYCRRWEDNSDASLDMRKMNENNLYKDRLRSWELTARIHKNKEI